MKSQTIPFDKEDTECINKAKNLYKYRGNESAVNRPIIMSRIDPKSIIKYYTEHKKCPSNYNIIGKRNDSNLPMVIPFIIWQTWAFHSIVNGSALLRENIEKFTNLGFDYHLIDDCQMELLFTDEKLTTNVEHQIFNGNITKAFLMINPVNGAARADFWRYYVLWKFGGVYIDMDTGFCEISVPYFHRVYAQKTSGNAVDNNSDNVPFTILTQPATHVTSRKQPQFVQWVAIYSAHHPFLTETIKTLINKIFNHDVPNNVNARQKTVVITGPEMYTDAVYQVINHWWKYPPFDFFFGDSDYNHCGIECEFKSGGVMAKYMYGKPINSSRKRISKYITLSKGYSFLLKEKN